MKPKFKDRQAWELAQVLMQPTFIRVIDNLGKELENSNWKSNYEEYQSPYPGYQLCLTKGESSIKIDIWSICFQVCFLNYHPNFNNNDFEDTETTQEVSIDTNLLDSTGDIDWQSLDIKTKEVIKQILTNLLSEEK